MARRGYPSVLELVGRTPIVRLEKLSRDVPGELLAKLEYLNSGGSVKDRIGLAMIEAAEQQGLLKPGERSSSQRRAIPAPASPWRPRFVAIDASSSCQTR